ncbi:hypothetical protein [Acinetobacter colistiniresistens]|uniref:hypothetical protein n=1 Tax=Acinetobacter colistiniresistens TaxID=280145 RepID=UPI0012503B6E|nr:hypothetical protein [Acinetobacter colistiniresistens]
MLTSQTKTVIALATIAVLSTGCATSTLIKKDNRTYTRTEKVTLIEDNVNRTGFVGESIF